MAGRIALDLLRQRVNLGDDEHEDDNLLEEMERAAWGFIEDGTGITYPDAGSATEYVKGLGARELYLAGTPSADPSAVIERTDAGDAGTAIVAADSDGWVRRNSVLVRKGASGVWRADAEYEIQYAGGYAANAQPPAVREAAMQIVAYLYSNLDKAGMRSGTVGANYSWAKEEEPIQSIIKALPCRPVFA